MSIPTQEIPVGAVFQGTVLRGTTVAHTANPHRDLTLAGATLVFYAGSRADAGDAVKERWGYRRVPGGEVATPELGRARVADDGTFQASLSEAADVVLVAISVDKFAFTPGGRRAFGVLGVAAPKWSEGRQRGASLDLSLPPGDFCGILSDMDLWMVSGRVADCENAKDALAGGTVTAFDRDLSQDDSLGSATTDAGGNFFIFFPSAQFKKIPLLPPPFDTVLPFELFGGPDVFFRVTQGANTLLDEPPTQGRTAGRENVPRCSYHELCVKAPAWTPQTITLWSRIGNIQVPDGGGLHGFDADGLTTGKEAFFGELDFNGQLSQKYLGEAVSFRFVWAEWPDLATAPAYPAAYQPLLGANLDLNAPYGSIYTFIGPDPWNFTLAPVLPVPDADGWVAVDQSPNFVRDTGRLVAVRSDTLVPAVGAPGDMQGTSDAGAPVPFALRDRHRKFSFVLEIRTASHDAHQAVPVPIHINNSLAYMHFDLSELAANGCSTVMQAGAKITVHPSYSVAHPYLSSYTIDVQRQGGTYSVVKTDSSGAHGPLWTDPAGEVGSFAADYTDVGHCSYRSNITAHRRLTNGYGGPGHQTLLRTFCVE